MNGPVYVSLNFFDSLDVCKLLIKIYTLFDIFIVTSFPAVYFLSQAWILNIYSHRIWSISSISATGKSVCTSGLMLEALEDISCIKGWWLGFS